MLDLFVAELPQKKKRFSVGVLYVFCDFHLSLRGTKQSVPIFYILIISILFIVSLSVVKTWRVLKIQN
jgi:hypothetical protein